MLDGNRKGNACVEKNKKEGRAKKKSESYGLPLRFI
jgi:hypothetical protein